MAEHSHIEWTDATWNPITGCSIVSPGCTNCYAMKLAGGRLKNHPSRKGLTIETRSGPVWNDEVRFNEEWLDQPLRWGRPRMIFVCAHGDPFHPKVTDEWLDRIFAVMALAEHHTFQVLTKRGDRMREYFAMRNDYPLTQQTEPRVKREAYWIAKGRGEKVDEDYWDAWFQWPLPNVWLGVSCEDQTRANERIPDLLRTPAAVRFISAEPLLGPVNLAPIHTTDYRYGGDHAGIYALQTEDSYQVPGSHFKEDHPALDWVIVGGESGPGSRPMHPDWARLLRDQCTAAGVAFHFKQWGNFAPGHAILWSDRNRIKPRTTTHEHAEALMYPVGKNRAGRILDGRTWNEMPTRKAA